MRLTHSSDGFAVFDDFLNGRDFNRVWNYVLDEQYENVHQRQWVKVFALGTPFHGPTYRVYVDRVGSDAAKVMPGMIVFLNRLRERLGTFAPWVGQPYKGWRSFSAQPYLYPVSTGLRWHDDGIRAGAFVFYAHPKWGANWGGELLVADRRNRPPGSRRRRSHLVTTALATPHDSAAAITGISTAIAPRPNRLIIIKGRYEHCIKPVAEAAGEHLRASISGFFHTKEDVPIEVRAPPKTAPSPAR